MGRTKDRKTDLRCTVRRLLMRVGMVSESVGEVGLTV